MSTTGPEPEVEWSFSALEGIDKACDAFERAWPMNPRLSIERCLAENPELPRSLLLYELLRVEMYLRLQQGEALDERAYHERFAGHEETIARARQAAETRSAASSGPADITASWTSLGPAEEEDLKQIGRYQIVRSLGQGGFGKVYLARDPIENRDVAIKVLRPELVDSPQRREELRKEALVGAKLDHPHLLKTYGVEEDGERLFIVQRYVDGGHLAEWHATHQPTPEQLVTLLIPVARAVAYLHEQGYIHRDLKPENILVDRSGHPLVSDFGLSLHEADQRSRRGEFAGTRAYMSPEQVRRHVDLADGRSDLWSLGVILYRLLANRLPFGGPPPRRGAANLDSYYSGLCDEIQEHDPKPLRQIRPDLSRRLEEICLRCLEKRERDRYQTGHDLAEDLALYLARARRGDGATATPHLPLQVIPKGLRSFDEHDQEFFAELVPGPRRSDGLPTGIGFWLDRLVGSDTANPLDVGVLVGPSGSGKSSLVKAGLLPRLGPKFMPVLIEATPQDTEVRLLKALRGAMPELPEDASLIDACLRISDRGVDRNRRILVVIDQFEQWLYAHPEAAQEQLLAALKQCNGTRLQVLLLTRDDFWMPLTRAMDSLDVELQEGKNLAAVDLFDRDHARKVLQAFGRAYQRLPAEGDPNSDQQRFLDQAIDGLADGGRIVCVRLALFAEMMKERDWTPAQLQAVGGAKGIGVAFLEEKFGAAAPPAYRAHRKAVPSILESLLPPVGSDLKGQPRTVDELRRLSGYADQRAFGELLHLLDGGLRILTPYAPDVSFSDTPSLGQAGQAYQLTHDFLVPSIRQWLSTDLGRTAAGRAKLRLRERSDDWNRRPEARRLPSVLEWLLIQLLTPHGKWTRPQRAMMSSATRRILGRAAMLVAAIVLVAVVGWEWRGRALARTHVDALRSAATATVPSRAAQAHGVWRWAEPALQQAYGAALPAAELRSELTDDQFRQLLNLGLVLTPDDPHKLDPVFDQIGRVPPQDLPTIVRMIGEPSKSLTDSLGVRLHKALRAGSSDTLPLAVVLGQLNRNHSSLFLAAPELARRLRDARPGEFPVWRDQLLPLAGLLRPHLLDLWRAGPPDRSRARAQLAESLAVLSADDLHTLVGAIEDAAPTEFEVLIPPLRKLGTAASVALQERFEEIQRQASAPFPPADMSPPDADVARLVEPYQGQLDRFGGLALAVPRAELPDLCVRLFKAGYRPRAVRPYQQGEQKLASVTWLRDSRDYRLELDQPTAAFRAEIEQHQGDGFQPEDVADVSDWVGGKTDAASVAWCGVWVKKRREDVDVVLDCEVPAEAVKQQEDQRSNNGYHKVSTFERTDASGAKWQTTLWAKLEVATRERQQSQVFIASGWALTRYPRSEDTFGELYAGALQTDIRFRAAASPASTDLAKDRAGDQRRTSQAKPFTGVWRYSPRDRMESQLEFGQTSDACLRCSAKLFLENYNPVVIEPYRSAEGGQFFGTVWHRVARRPPESIVDAKRIASLAIAAAFCGRKSPLDNVLSTRGPIRDAHSFTIERLAPAGYSTAILAERLSDPTANAIMKRAVVLSLGGYPESDIPVPTQELIQTWAAHEPDPEVQAAAAWFCRRAARSYAVASPKNTSAARKADDPSWYLGPEGHVMIVLPEGRFRIGAPEWESESSAETRYWTHIPRRHALSATPVTVAQFRRFLEHGSVRDRLPTKYLELLKTKRNALTETMWHVDGPQSGLVRLEAMLYCEWLSEQAGLDDNDRCYPGIWETAAKWAGAGTVPDYRPPAEAVHRRGYRLPTDAEFERASRGGGEQSRHFGDSDELLGAYCWYRDNSQNRLQPVGLKKPNEFGFCDTLGNVSQYCFDFYPGQRPPPSSRWFIDEPDLSEPATRFYSQRGGDFDSPPRDLRAAKRLSVSHTNNRFTHGFRVARTEE